MRAVKADVTSSKPISLSKASEALSLFAASKTVAQPDVSAYLRRAAAAFEELVAVHHEIRNQRKISKVGKKIDGSHRKRKGKETDREEDTHGGNSLLEQQQFDVELSKDELKSDKVESYGTRSEDCRYKRKHSNAENNQMDGEVEQHQGKKRRR